MQKSTMSVAEMRRLLGLGKTDSYWLCHQGFFETVLVNGKMRVVIDSFENWYTMQTKHRKVTGEEPGTRLHEETLSAKEIADLLGICKQQAQVLIRQVGLPFVKVHSQFLVSKVAFDAWYAGQTHYVRKEERDKVLKGKWITLTHMAEMLGIRRSMAHCIVKSKSGQSVFSTLKIGRHCYVTVESFEQWLNSQSKYHLVPKQKHRTECRKVCNPRIQLRKPKNPAYYTVEEISRFYGLRHSELYEKLASGDIPAVRTGKTWRVKRAEFDEMLTGRSED